VPLKRIFAAAPERLQLLGPRLAPFKVQRTINYPIDLEELWLAIAQVTSGPNDETDGTIERVVLDERGIPSTGSMPRAPIPPRPPAPLSAAASPPTPVASTSTSASGRYATARVVQPVPEPPLRAPPPPCTPPPAARAPAPPRMTSDTGRMRAPVMPPMTATPPAPESVEPVWTAEVPRDDDFAEVAAQARFGVQQKVADEAAKRRRQRLFAAGGIAVVVASAIVFLIEKFYDPAARVRERAIAAEVKRMSEQQKVTDDLTLIEIDIENAIMNNDLGRARAELAQLIERSPDHPRREFLEKSIERAAELARLSPDSAGTGEKTAQGPVQAAVMPSSDRPARARAAVKAPARAADRPAQPRTPDRIVAARPREIPPASSGTRSFGAPINDSTREAVIPLDAPINAPPTYTARRPDNSFAGRTVEASDSGVGRGSAAPAPAYQAPVTNAAVPAAADKSGSAAAPTPNVAPSAAPKPPAPLDVVPAKIVKRVMPVAPAGVSRKTTGFVVLSYNIQTNGKVSDIQVVESEPAGVFDDSARDAVRRWLYEPRKENGVAVASPGKARLVFDGSTTN
jgi:TonB family protein